jgi:hypothetical protein
MNWLPNGKVYYDNLAEMQYNLFMEIGFAVNAQGYLYDTDNGNTQPIKYKDKLIKASVDGTPVYAGRNDVVFEPDKNYGMVNTLFGYFLDKLINTDDEDLHLDGYIAHYIEDDPTREYQRVVVKTTHGEIYSDFYLNAYLGYIDSMFKLTHNNVDLHNLDIRVEK